VRRKDDNIVSNDSIVNVGELEVLVRPVPPTASVHWQKAHVRLPKKPSRPMQEITSKLDGHTEIVPALPDSDEWNAWVLKMQDWYAQVDDIREEHIQDQMQFYMDYAILGWRNADSQDEWQEMPDEEWEIPAALTRHGVDSINDKRVAYIMYAILDENWKVQAVASKAWPEGRDAERDDSPVTREEVAAVLDKFPGRDEDSGRPMDASAGGTRVRRADERIRTRDAASRGNCRRPGFLVRALKRLSGDTDGIE